MKHVKTLNNKTLKESMKKGGCGECQTSCQSACKTSCTVGNQSSRIRTDNDRTALQAKIRKPKDSLWSEL